MPGFVHFMRCVGNAVVKNGGRALAGLVPFGEVLYKIASSAYEDYRKEHGEAELRAELQCLAQASPTEVHQAAELIAAMEPIDARLALVSYLDQLPAVVRQSLCRPSDPGGTTVPSGRLLGKPEDLLAYLPTGLPRFKLVICSHCQRESTDPEFCDHCNQEIRGNIGGNPPLPLTLEVAGEQSIDCSAWKGVWPADYLRSIEADWGDGHYRLYGLSPPRWQGLESVVRQRASTRLASLPPIRVFPVAEGAIVAAEGLSAARIGWPGRPVAATAGDELWHLDQLVVACQTLHRAFAPLHQAGFIWLNFDPTRLEVCGKRVRITNLDLQLFRAGDCPENLPRFRAVFATRNPPLSPRQDRPRDGRLSSGYIRLLLAGRPATGWISGQRPASLQL